MLPSVSAPYHHELAARQLADSASSSQQREGLQEGGQRHDLGGHLPDQSHQLTSYRVSLGGGVADQNPTYTNPNLSARAAANTTAIESPPPLLDGAKNILSLIEQRLASEKAAGASTATLTELLQQGLSGFQQGYAEAETQLKARGGQGGELEEGVANTIATLYQQVVDGLEALRANYINTDGGLAQVNELAPQQPANMTPSFIAKATVDSNSVGHALVNKAGLLEDMATIWQHGHRAEGGAYTERLQAHLDHQVSTATIEYGRTETFSFELVTQDGDTITINASNMAAFSGQYGEAASLEGHSHQQQFSMDVVGELDEQETQAIANLLGDIMGLAGEFYNGDIHQAYEAALNLGYDQSEIAGYALRLYQAEQYSVAATYQALLPATDPLVSVPKDIFSVIGDYAQQVIATLGNPLNDGRFDYRQLLLGLSQQLDQQIAPVSGVGFHSVLADFIQPLGHVRDSAV